LRAFQAVLCGSYEIVCPPISNSYPLQKILGGQAGFSVTATIPNIEDDETTVRLRNRSC
jgi:hypothetical protein